MTFRKNWFCNFCIAWTAVGMLYCILAGFLQLEEKERYPFLTKGTALGLLFGGILLIQLIVYFVAKVRQSERVNQKNSLLQILAKVFLTMIFVGAGIMRLYAILHIPADFVMNTEKYYEIADILKQGTLLENHADYATYLAMFPYKAGYSYILKLVFQMTGTHMLSAQILNIICSMLSVYLVYRIACRVGGIVAGILAAGIIAFWPSQVLSGMVIAPDTIANCLLLAGILIYLKCRQDYGTESTEAAISVFLHIIVGVLMAFAIVLKPIGILLLTAMLICDCCYKMQLPNLPLNDIPLMTRLLSKIWRRGLLIVLPCILCIGIINSNISYMTDEKLPAWRDMLGYSVFTGLNIDNNGQYNLEDEAFLANLMKKAETPAEVQKICREKAVERFQKNPAASLNLFFQKYETMFSNDDHMINDMIEKIQKQGKNMQLYAKMYQVRRFEQLLYLGMLGLAVIGLIRARRNEIANVLLILLFYLGVSAAYAIAGIQNSYSNITFLLIAMLAVTAIQNMYREAARLIVGKSEDEITEQQERDNQEKQKTMLKAMEQQANEMREKAMENVFDMDYAIKHGHVTMTVSKAYAPKEEQEKEQTDNQESEKE